MLLIWKLVGARQASFGIATDHPESFETLLESHGEVDLSIEYGCGVEVVGELSQGTSAEDRHNALCRLEGWPTTWAEQERTRADAALADSLPFAEEI